MQQMVKHHWIATVQTAHGLIATEHGSFDVTPGQTTHTATFSQVREVLAGKYDAPNLVFLFFALHPDQL
ncbi:hypothetical protein JJV70_06610 [Streptomyces sp. JJ66]|uniref:hypothetical protein n=1 Tax=Streptomyces sp. JJ66 TaxID=2803843 RepID=UPI001C572869|nr:hypothetical protein [Streptomyces sp. JJ66]MBW1601787.1 hypothetical protein [Streptomyces sp. JJ66]